jgi:hypothetical protein
MEAQDISQHIKVLMHTKRAIQTSLRSVLALAEIRPHCAVCGGVGSLHSAAIRLATYGIGLVDGNLCALDHFLQMRWQIGKAIGNHRIRCRCSALSHTVLSTSGTSGTEID